jgi:hypothetical protein
LSGTSEFWNAINRPLKKPPVIEHRAYHVDGKVTSAHSGPVDGDWPDGDSIVISAEMYKNTSLLYRSRVIKGELVQVKLADPRTIQLEPATTGPYTSLKDNIIFAAKKGDNYKQKEYNVKIGNNGQ